MAPDDAAGLPDAVLRYAAHDDGVVDVHLPPGPSRPRPLVFYVHGGFWRQRWDRTHARPLAEALAARGHVVALPEYRRVGGRGGWPTTADDVEAALQATPGLLAGAGVPITTTTLVGHSAGGHLVLWLAGQRRSVAGVDRVVALAPVGDLRSAAGRGLGAGATQELLGGSPEEVPEVYAAADPASRLDVRPAAEVVLVHGDRDEDVPVDLSRGLVARHPWIDHRELAGVGHSEVIDPLSSAWPAVLAAIEGRR
jgi:acetyl esterase/lipase